MGIFNFWKKTNKIKLTDDAPKGNTKGSAIYHLIEESRQKDGSILVKDFGKLSKNELDDVKRQRLTELNSRAEKLQKDLTKIDKNINSLIELRDEILTQIQQNNKQVRNYGRI